MVQEIKIIATTETGHKALMQHIEEKRKAKVHQIMIYNKFFTDSISLNPLTLTINLNKLLRELINPDHLILEIHKTMGQNGAKPEDYKIEVL